MSYDDADNEILDLTRISWRFYKRALQPLPISGNPTVLSAIVDYFRDCSFMQYHAQALLNYLHDEPFFNGEKTFNRTLQAVPLAVVSHDANNISNLTMYRIMVLDKDASMYLKALTAPYLNEGCVNKVFWTDFWMCPPVRMRIVISTISLHRWPQLS